VPKAIAALLAVDGRDTGHAKPSLRRAFATLATPADTEITVLTAGLTVIEFGTAAILM
jgi:hypothetical protein